MTHTLVNYRDVEPAGNALYFLRDALDCTQLGLSVFELSPGDGGKEHDHGHDGQEEVYFLVEGDASIVVDGEVVEMRPGDALRVDSEHTRQIRNGDEESLFVIVGAT